MGLPMAKNLCTAGLNITVWNRSADKTKPLVKHGAGVASTPMDAVQGASLIISMVSDGAVLAKLTRDKSVQNALSSSESPTPIWPKIWIDMSSTKPDEARQTADRLAPFAHFLDAPVSGGTIGAQNATLAIMAGGDPDHFTTAKPVLSHLGNPVHVGPVGAGQLAKLANQLIVASTIGAVAEAMLLLERGGADCHAVRSALKGGFADSTILQQHGARMQARDFTPGGLSHLQLKDLDNITTVANALNLSLPMTAQTRARFARYVAELNGAMKDHSGLFEELLNTNNLP